MSMINIFSESDYESDVVDIYLALRDEEESLLADQADEFYAESLDEMWEDASHEK